MLSPRERRPPLYMCAAAAGAEAYNTRRARPRGTVPRELRNLRGVRRSLVGDATGSRATNLAIPERFGRFEPARERVLNRRGEARRCGARRRSSAPFPEGLAPRWPSRRARPSSASTSARSRQVRLGEASVLVRPSFRDVLERPSSSREWKGGAQLASAGRRSAVPPFQTSARRLRGAARFECARELFGKARKVGLIVVCWDTWLSKAGGRARGWRFFSVKGRGGYRLLAMT